MASVFYIKQGDLKPTLRAVLREPDGTPVQLQDRSVEFAMGLITDDPKFRSPAAVVDAPAGVVEYNWVAGNTEDAGTFQAEFIVVNSDATEERFPNDSYITVEIMSQVG